jgi:hypothetical protein
MVELRQFMDGYHQDGKGPTSQPEDEECSRLPATCAWCPMSSPVFDGASRRIKRMLALAACPRTVDHLGDGRTGEAFDRP